MPSHYRQITTTVVTGQSAVMDRLAARAPLASWVGVAVEDTALTDIKVISHDPEVPVLLDCIRATRAVPVWIASTRITVVPAEEIRLVFRARLALSDTAA